MLHEIPPLDTVESADMLSLTCAKGSSSFDCGMKISTLCFSFFSLFRSLLGIPKLVINNHKSFIRVVEIPSTRESKLSARDDFVKVDNTSDKVRYSTLKLQELNAELKSLQEEYERVQRALSDELCQQVKFCFYNLF